MSSHREVFGHDQTGEECHESLEKKAQVHPYVNMKEERSFGNWKKLRRIGDTV